MVVTFLPATAEMAVWHERAASPLIWTVHAPQRPAPQPNLVPVLSSVSRSTQRSGMSGPTSTVWDFPLRIKVVAIGGPPGGRGVSYNTRAVDENQRIFGDITISTAKARLRKTRVQTRRTRESKQRDLRGDFYAGAGGGGASGSPPRQPTGRPLTASFTERNNTTYISCR